MLQSQFWSLVTLLCLSLANCQQCSNRPYSLQSNLPINLTSVNYPRAFPAGSSCRYYLRAPVNHIIELTCNFQVYPNNCQSTFLYISVDGDNQFRNAERICQTSRVSRTSYFQALSLAYQSANAATQPRATLFCQAVARPRRCDCGWSYPVRIANGIEAAKHEFPSMVALRDITSTRSMFCGGSIISNRYIATAAHCMNIQSVASRILALIGDHDLSSNTESTYADKYTIRSIIVHPDYNRQRNFNDIALLQTVKSIEWSRGIAPICLGFAQRPSTQAFLTVSIAGWGTLGFSAPSSRTLQKANLMTIPNANCNERYNGSIATTQICTDDYLGLGQDACQYDSGGPVIQSQNGRMYLLGVISYGRFCGERHGIGVNTRISSFLPWIGRYVRGSVCVR